MVLTREEILAARTDAPSQIVEREIEGLGTVCLRSLSGADVDYLGYLGRREARGEAIDFLGWLARQTLANPDGTPMFGSGADDVAAVSALPGAVLGRIREAVMEISGVTPEALETAAKNFEAPRDGTNGTASPPSAD